MPESAQQQVQADVNAIQSARNDLNNANTVVANSRLTPAQKAQIHTQLATVAGVLQTAETAAQAWLAANPPPPPPPPPATVPGPPTGLVAAPTTTSAVLSWSAPSSTGGALITDYDVDLAGAPVVTTQGTNASLTGLTPGTAYTATVAAVNSVGAGPAASVSFTTQAVAPPPPPPPPSGWVPPATPSPGPAATVKPPLVSANGTSALNGAVGIESYQGPPAVGPTPGNYTPSWQGAHPNVNFTNCTGAVAYQVRDLDGLIVSEGPVTGDACTPTPPAGGWPYGWYRIYLFSSTPPASGPTADNCIDINDFTIIRADANIAPESSSPGWNLDNGCAFISHTLGYGVIRYSISDSTVQPNPDVEFYLGQGMQQPETVENESWLKAYLDPVRPHAVFVAADFNPASPADLTTCVQELVAAGVEWFEGPSNEPDIASDGFAQLCQQFASAVHAGGGKAIGPCAPLNNGTYIAMWDPFLNYTPVVGHTYLLVCSNVNSNVNTSSVSGGGANWTKLASIPYGDLWMGRITAVDGSPVVSDYSGATTMSVQIVEVEAPDIALVSFASAPQTHGERFAFSLENGTLSFRMGNGVGPDMLGTLSGVTATTNFWGGDYEVSGGSTTSSLTPAPGGAEFFDALSTHGYNSFLGDINQGRRNWGNWAALMARHSVQKPLWMTECGNMGSVYGVYHPRRFARQNLIWYLIMEEVGLPREHVAFFQPHPLIGPAFPSYWQTNRGNLPNFNRVAAEECFGKTFTKALSFGEPIDHFVLADLFSAPSAGPSVVVVVSECPVPNTFVSFEVNTAAALVLVDGWGNESSTSPVGGVVTIPVYDVPTWIELPAGVTASPVPVNAGPNLALSATANSPLINDGEYGKVGGQYDASPTPYQGTVQPSATAPDKTVKLTWPTAQSVGRVVVHAPSPWQSNSTLTDFDIVDQSGKVLATVTNEPPPPLGYPSSGNGVDCCAETYWTEPFVFDVRFTPESLTGIGLVARGVSFGGEPDSYCANLGGTGVWPNSLGQGDPTPVLTISQIECFAS